MDGETDAGNPPAYSQGTVRNQPCDGFAFLALSQTNKRDAERHRDKETERHTERAFDYGFHGRLSFASTALPENEARCPIAT